LREGVPTAGDRRRPSAWLHGLSHVRFAPVRARLPGSGCGSPGDEPGRDLGVQDRARPADRGASTLDSRVLTGLRCGPLARLGRCVASIGLGAYRALAERLDPMRTAEHVLRDINRIATARAELYASLGG